MSTPVPIDPESEPSTTASAPAEASHAVHNDHLDPITGEPHAHPVGVGVGAMGAGAIGAAIGAFAGPIGVVVGAAIGAIAGGLAGKEVAEEPEISPTAEEGAPLDEFEHASTATVEEELPLSPTLSEHTNPADDDFFTGGTASGNDLDTKETRLDEFDRPHSAAPVATSTPPALVSTATPNTLATPTTASPIAPAAAIPAEEEPLPTASSGLVTPDESSFFADSTTGESSVLTESPLPAAFAVSAEGTTDSVDDSASYGGHFDAEHTVRTAAYYRYLDRETTGQPGSDFTDWIEAEKEVLSH